MADDSASFLDDLEVLEMAMEQANAAAQAFLLLAEGARILMSTQHDGGEKEESPKVRRQRDLLDRPGRRNAVVEVRADYIRGQSRRVYDNIRFAHHPAHFHDITLALKSSIIFMTLLLRRLPKRLILASQRRTVSEQNNQEREFWRMKSSFSLSKYSLWA